MVGLMTLWGHKLEQTAPEGLHTVEGTHIGAVLEEPLPMGRAYVEVHGESSPMGETPC